MHFRRLLRLPRLLSLVAGGLVLALATSACSGRAASDPGSPTADTETDALEVLASFYPLQYVAERVGGEEVAVSSLTPPRAEPHDLELSPAQVRAVGQADVVLYLQGFQPAVDEAVTARSPAHVLDAATVVGPAAGTGHEHEHVEDAHDHGEADPHFWLDPTRLAVYTDAVVEVLSQAEPEAADRFAARAAALRNDLNALDADISAGLESCQSRVIVTAHDAFGYLAERYHLEQVAIAGLEPESEPSPARLRQVATAVKDEDVTTIFYETLVSPKVAEVLAADLGVETAVLDPVEGLVDDRADYLSVMRGNLDALRSALRCA